MEAKKASESRTVKAVMVFPPDTNNHGTIFGGKVMAYIDEVAAIAAAKHSRRAVVTASIDSIDFLSPVKVGYCIYLDAVVTATGETSMEVFVKVIAENLLTGERKLTTTSFLTFVALDEHGKPTTVPQVIPETDEEIYLHRTAPERKKMRKQRREDFRSFVNRLNMEVNV
ncbi:acyl-CoA thioesterase [Bacillaceae bacterium]